MSSPWRPIPADLPQVFDERFKPLSADHSTPVDVQTIFDVLYKLVFVLNVRHDATVLVHTLVVVEHLVRACPNCMGVHTWRPILLTAFVLSVKKYFDEQTTGIVHSLHRAGFAGIDEHRLFCYETSFLAFLGWNIEVSRREYTLYAFALRDLISRHLDLLTEQCAGMITLALTLGSMNDYGANATPKAFGGDRPAPRCILRTPPAVPTWASDEQHVASLYGLVTAW